MRTKRKPLFLTLTSLTGGIGLGLLISFLLFPHNNVKVITQPHEPLELSPFTGDTDDQKSGLVPRTLEDIVKLEDITVQRRVLYRVLENKSGDEIADLLGRTLSMGRTQNVYSVQRVLFGELARIDPAKSLELVWETQRTRWETLLDIVAIHWSTIAPVEALEAFSSLKDPWQGRAIKTVFQHQNSLTEAELVEIADSLDIKDHFNLWVCQFELLELIDEPPRAFNFVLKAEVSEFDKQRMFKRITRRWIENENTVDIGNMINLVGEIFIDTEYPLWEAVIEEIAALNPEVAWKHLTSLPIETQLLLDSAVFRAWVDKDSIAAIRAITTEEFMGSMKSELRYLLMDWVRGLSGQVLQYIDLVPEDLKTFVVNDAVGYLMQTLPPNEIFETLAQFRSKGISTLQATVDFVSTWSRTNPAAAVQWALQNLDRGTTHGQFLLRFALEEFALSDSSKAMEIALELPIESAMEQHVVLALINKGKIDEGLSLLSQIRTSHNAEYIFGRLGGTLVEVGRLEDAFALGDRLAESQKPAFYRGLAWPWLNSNLESLLETLPQLENAEIRSLIASGVIRQQEQYPFLTEEELEDVRALISNESN